MDYNKYQPILEENVTFSQEYEAEKRSAKGMLLSSEFMCACHNYNFVLFFMFMKYKVNVH